MSQLNDTNDFLSLRVGDLSNREVIDLPIFHERVINVQPTNDEYPGVRRPIPVSTLDWRSTHFTQFTPLSGLDFLKGVEQLNIQQTVELHDMLAHVESENRYTVKVPQGETLYMASESSKSWQRMCLGSGRGFSLTLYDQTQQQCMQIVRRLACSNCLFGCYLQEVQIWLPPGELIGTIRQNWAFMATTFVVYDDEDRPVYRLEGPNVCSCTSYKDAAFNVMSWDGLTQLSSIRHQWDQLMVGYNLSVFFPERNTDVKEKALLLAAGFLLEYMFFEQAKSSRSCKCIC